MTIFSLANPVGSTSNTNSYAGTAGTPAANDLLICFVSASGTVATGTMTGGGWTWTKLTSFTKNSGNDTIYVFYAHATAATSTAPTFDCTGDNATGAIIHCWRVSGAEGRIQPSIRQIKTATGTTTNPSITMDRAILTGNGVISIVANGNNSAAQFTNPTSWTTDLEASYNTPTNGMGSSKRDSGETGTTITWTCASTTAWGMIVIELWNPRFRATGGAITTSGAMVF
jgi:hypothetical protein